jgi:N-acetylmuramoyl-L-alanine amidase
MRLINEIVIHCSATPEDRYFGPEELEAMHAARGIRKPGGYHYLISNHGERTTIRPINEIGAHIYGHNTDTVGICYSGGIVAGGNPNKASDAKDTRTPRQKVMLVDTIVNVLKELRKHQSIDHIKVRGHRDYSPDVDGDGIIEPWEWMKQCPCFDATKEYEHILKIVPEL